jgi:hypothetical protein
VNFTEQKRMQGDPAYGEAIARLRTCQCNMEDVELFNSCVIKSFDHPNGINLSSCSNIDAACIVPTNLLRQTLNEHKARSNITAENQLIICASLDKISSTIVPSPTRESLLRLNTLALKDTKALPGYISLYNGMPIVLHDKNPSTDLKITNGSQGYIRKISTTTCSSNLTYATSVIVEFPGSPVHLPGLPKGFFPFEPTTRSFFTELESQPGIRTKVHVTHHQLSIQPAFAVTGHSAQGKTLPKVLVSLKEGGFPAYVAGSRATSKRRSLHYRTCYPPRLE